MNKLFIILAATVLFGACSEKKNIVYENDTDYHDWINQQTIKSVSEPHSGSSASVSDSTHPYSLGFRKTIKNISSTKIKKVKFSYWVYSMNDSINATTVFSVDFNGKNISWEGRPLKVEELNKWVYKIEEFGLPRDAQPNNEVSLYIWNNAKQEIWLDDLKVEFE